MSFPAALALARSRRTEAWESLAPTIAAYVVPTQENKFLFEAHVAAAKETDQALDIAQGAADTAAQALLSELFVSHHIPFPSSETMANLVSAMHNDSFANLAQLANTHFSSEVILALRNAWRMHHQRAQHTPGSLDDQIPRALACTTFGDLARILEDELHLADNGFQIMSWLWRYYRAEPSTAVSLATHPVCWTELVRTMPISRLGHQTVRFTVTGVKNTAVPVMKNARNGTGDMNP
ncbi:hypothetical protein C8R45DRAFT_922882 [Mycena sanguinolenta]|nr:hypothetical protein C8R45DRAFT_922882 [Mycena sanguinolenta]